MSRDLQLSLTEHDLVIENHDLQLIDGDDEIRQRLKTRLLLFRGEWFLDTTVGVPYYQDILVKNPNLGNVDAIFKAEILDTVGVNQLIEYQSEYDNSLRKLNVTFTVSTENGTTITETI